MTSSGQDDFFVGPTPAQRQPGQPSWDRSTATFQLAMEVFHKSGVCAIKNCLPTSFANTCRDLANKDLSFLQQQLEHQRNAASRADHHLNVAVQRCDFAEMVARDGGRYDVRFHTDRFPYISPGLIYNPIVFPLVAELLGGSSSGEGINLLYAGVMWAQAAGAPDASDTSPQRWHADGGHCFDYPNAPHLPPHCINVFYPLLDLKVEHGPTEFVPGTHIFGQLNSSTLNATSNQVKLTCDLGGCILFDYRVKHRGSKNRSQEPRPILYLCYAKNWFRDSGNLRSARTVVVPKKNGEDASLQWRSRILKGKAMPMGKGFDVGIVSAKGVAAAAPTAPTAAAAAAAATADGSGERWVLFHMDVELGDETETIIVYSGDVALEVASQFCLRKNLDDAVISVLQEQIQKQMNAALQ